MHCATPEDNTACARAHTPVRLPLLALLLLIALVLPGCRAKNPEEAAVKATIMRYNQLVSEGYRTHNMNPLSQVTTRGQAEKLYYHMAAIGEGRLRMDATLKTITFDKFEFQKPGEALVETAETWDFKHVVETSGKTYAEEKDFVYQMGYQLKKAEGRWIIQSADTISGHATTTVVPWPKVDRQGNPLDPTAKAKEGKPAAHP
jgi:hypothetical protein